MEAQEAVQGLAAPGGFRRRPANGSGLIFRLNIYIHDPYTQQGNGFYAQIQDPHMW